MRLPHWSDDGREIESREMLADSRFNFSSYLFLSNPCAAQGGRKRGLQLCP
jgi:hypothetical protein